MDKKEQQERHFVDLVRKGVADFPPGNIIKVPDPPDLVLQEATGNFAIEVTCIFQEGSAHQPLPKREDSERIQVLERARAICTEMNLPPLQVSVLLGYDPPLTKKNREQIAQSIARIVEANVPSDEYGAIHWDNDFQDLATTPAKIVSISILRLRITSQPCWSPLCGGWLDSDFSPQLQATIDVKERDLPKYRNRYRQCWLVIAAEGFQPSSLFSFSDQMAAHVFQATFDRVFFVEGFQGRVNELRLSSSVGQPIPPVLT